MVVMVWLESSMPRTVIAFRVESGEEMRARPGAKASMAIRRKLRIAIG